MSSHRPTLKQQNKPFKSKFASKGEVRRSVQGKIEKKREGVKNASKSQTKLDRRNKTKQVIASKRASLISKRRAGALPDSNCPKIVGIITLGGDSSKLTREAKTRIVSELVAPPAETLDTFADQSGPVFVNVRDCKDRMIIFETSPTLSSVLNAAKFADVLLFLVPALEGIDQFGEELISLVKAQGMPAVVGAIVGLEEIPIKNRNDLKKSLIKLFQFHFTDASKIVPLSTEQDASVLVRTLVNSKLKKLAWRDIRPYLLGQNFEFQPSEQNDKEGTLVVTGFLRGSSLSANDLIHLPLFGDYQISKIEEEFDNFSHSRKKNEMQDDQSGERRVLHVPDEEILAQLKAEVLEARSSNKLLETNEVSAIQKTLLEKKRQVKVPKGTSEYQASWYNYLDDEEKGEQDGEDEDEDEASGEEGSEMDDEDDQGEGAALLKQAMEASEDEDEDEEQQDMKTELMSVVTDFYNEEELDKEMLSSREERLRRKREEEEEQLKYPNEKEVPLDAPARTRFQLYRGLKNFKTSVWDPKESLPPLYSMINQFQNFSRTKKKMIQERIFAPVPTGNYIRIHVTGVPSRFMEAHKAAVVDKKEMIGVSALLKSEHLMSIVNFVIQKDTYYDLPLESKEEMIIEAGFRTIRAHPVYSEYTHNIDKHTYERFLHPGRVCVGTICSPIIIPPSPILMFRPPAEGETQALTQLAAKGAVLGVDPDRIVLKKIILTGHPFKIHKRSSVIRDMFYFPDDIRWFKPVELSTKNGRRGNIIEPLGTHGLMKCRFDGMLKNDDTVLLPLYKRIFPLQFGAYFCDEKYVPKKKRDAVEVAESHMALE
eukprot:TRINITY_DN4140_c0_g1_i1.p1 TRINITY_DN4140_c0_g1~~TRINITY_DN4140_c0_g1_i1.p1  ORF type:complete len:825 (+),score=477.89 TRINITY_DN4140_c0_g1_i1:86-2560(+)